MHLQLVAIDLDGTLLHEDMSISEYSKWVIREATARIRIVIATGRMFDSARAKVQLLGLGDVPVICYTGALIGLAESGIVLHHEGLPMDTAKKILEDSRKYKWTMQSYIDDAIYLPAPAEAEIEEKSRRYRSKEVIYAGERFYHPEKEPTRFVLIEESEQKRKEIRSYLQKQYGHMVEMVHPGDVFLNIQKRGVSKGSALGMLGKEWGIPCEAMASFGNTENDVSMLAVTGWSYAVANAEAEAKAAAKVILKRTNEEDGPAHQLAELLDLKYK